MKIVTDCAADLSAKEREELGVVEAPLYIQFPEGEENAANIAPDDFYDRLEAMRPAIPTTAQPSAGIFHELYEKLAKTKEQILSIHISSGLSGTLNSAINGAGQLKEKVVSTVDSMTLSGGQRFQVLAAVQAAKAGWSMDAIKERLEAIRVKTEVIYTLETLEYLARGGRIGRVQALAGSVLKIKPIIHVDHADGKYSTLGKGRTIKKNIGAMVNHLSELYGDAPLWTTVLHGRFEKGADQMKAAMEAGLNVKKMEVARISPVLGVHTGPGIVGAAVLPMALMEDLI
ncbi:MAG: DegV family protein [Anaerolineae bacterium]|jgi:DegV family protein with EDD domain|nr:DegV family protein [Anaerolineae bacterium]MBT4310262.1 DegV family protein [Anaerolineae bacterium]MBT4460263.1 DegV family protein [Anaerolineae bacterium]MBT6059643.1 DegV family protein [Anaerolineae bacterium]MBT6324192.1 DegV family protein [Anaerolineae bacterium]